MNGFDCAHPYQKDINTAKVPADFVIAKVAQGMDYVNPQWRQMIDGALSSGKLGGLYYWSNGLGAQKEADRFVSMITPYIGKVILALDWELDSNKMYRKPGDTKYVEAWLQRVYQLTRVRPLIYINQGEVTRQGADWSGVSKISKLWLAQYKSNATQVGYTTPTGYGPLKYWAAPTIWQYTSHGRLPNFAGRIDLDVCYVSRGDWERMARQEAIETVTIKGITLPVLRIGCTGDAVRIWQGILGIKVTGVFDEDTRVQTLRYQQDHPSCGHPDAVVARKTWTTGLDGLR